MTHRNIRIAATSVVLVAAFVGLMWSTLREGTEYYKHVDEVMTTPQAWEGKRLQLHGFVVPDTFKDEAEVVLKGRLTTTGFHTEPNGVMAKCPSKYEASKKSASTGT